MQKPLLEIRHLNAIIILSEELNYTQAAIRLGMSQSGLSRLIQDAERRLTDGTQLSVCVGAKQSPSIVISEFSK